MSADVYLPKLSFFKHGNIFLSNQVNKKIKLKIKAILCQLKEFVIKLFSLTTNYNLSK
jgi:hypothetical protein